MRVALLTTFAASRKEPLAEMMERVHRGFLDAGLGEPEIRFNFGDGPLGGGISSVDRTLKRHPELERFVTTASPMPANIPGARRISNGPLSPAAGEMLAFTVLHSIASGVPRSFPFHTIALHFYTPEFGQLQTTPSLFAEMMAGVLLRDNWWVNGRTRSLSACAVVDGDPGSKHLPAPESPIAAALAACGKVKRVIQAPLPGRDEAPAAVPVRLPSGTVLASADPQKARAVQAIVLDYRARLPELVERAALPHVLPTAQQALLESSPGVTAGPKKPALERSFKPLGYECRGESGAFTLRRRTAANLTVELHLDVGTWSHSVMAIYRVWGMGFKGTLLLPVAASAAGGGQYPIGDAGRWQRIVENLAALVVELDRTFVPEIEAAAGPSPDWYRPES